MKPWYEREDPVLLEPGAADAAASRISFLQEEGPSHAGPWLWAAAVLVFAAYAALSLMTANARNAPLAVQIGVLVGSFLWPMVVVAISWLWVERRTQRTSVKVFAITCLVLLCIAGITFLSVRGYSWNRLSKSSFTAADFREQAGRCMQARDLECAESNWADYVRLRPDEGLGLVNLGMVLNERDKHAEAVVQFNKALSLGNGTYDLFAYHADSLAKLGRTDEAIDWSYKALSVVPTLVDVRGKLARLLVGAGRHYEALSLLQSFDSQRVARGMQPYFTGQRIAIETAIDNEGLAPTARAERAALRLPAYNGHFFAPVTIGSAKPAAFMVDTGATRTTLSEAVLRESKADFRVVDTRVQMQTADGRKSLAQAVLIESMKLGRFELRNVSALTCKDCVSLLGQSTLSSFDMQSSKVQGVEFLTLAPRANP